MDLISVATETTVIVLTFPNGKKYHGLGSRRTTAQTRAAIAALRDGINLRKSYNYIVEEYLWVGRYETAGIIVDEYA